MENFKSMNISNEPKVPTVEVPISYNQIEDSDMLDLHDPELWEKIKKLQEEEDTSEYNKMMERIVKQLEYNQEHNIPDGWEEEEQERRPKESNEDLYKKDPDEPYWQR